MTTRIRDIPVEVPLGPADGLPKASVANLDSLVTIPKARLKRRVAGLGRPRMGEVENALRFALGMD